MNHKDIDFKVIMLVVNHYWLVKERIEKLRELGYFVSSEWVRPGGIGSIRVIRKRQGVQISASIGGNGFVGKAYVAFKSQKDESKK